MVHPNMVQDAHAGGSVIEGVVRGRQGGKAVGELLVESVAWPRVAHRHAENLCSRGPVVKVMHIGG